MQLEAEIVGVNARDLGSFEIDRRAQLGSRASHATASSSPRAASTRARRAPAAASSRAHVRPRAPQPHLRARVDAALGDDEAVAWDARDEPELRAAVDLEAAEVSCVHADDLRLELHRAFQLVRVVSLDERVQPQPPRPGEQRLRSSVVDVASRISAASAPADFSSARSRPP